MVRDVVRVVVAASAKAGNAIPARTTNNADNGRDARIILAKAASEFLALQKQWEKPLVRCDEPPAQSICQVSGRRKGAKTLFRRAGRAPCVPRGRYRRHDPPLELLRAWSKIQIFYRNLTIAWLLLLIIIYCPSKSI